MPPELTTHDAKQSVTQIGIKSGEIGLDIFGIRRALARECLPSAYAGG
jgi:hypothetical protein